MLVSMSLAVSTNGVIGLNVSDNSKGSLLWRLPSDILRFVGNTRGKAVIMGGVTANSLQRPLPGRHNIVLTRYIPAPGFTQAVSELEALAAAGEFEEVVVIGGAKTYQTFAPYVSKVYLTEVQAEFTHSGAVKYEWVPPPTWRCVSGGQQFVQPAGDEYPTRYRVFIPFYPD